MRFIKMYLVKLTTGSYISVHSLRYEACRKFGEHKRCVRVAWGVAESNSSFLSNWIWLDKFTSFVINQFFQSPSESLNQLLTID